MMPELLVVLALCLLLAAVVVPWAQRHRRAEDLAAVAARNGLDYSAHDPFGLTRVPFPLFRKGDGRVAKHVVWRQREDGLPTRAFDFSYFVETKDDTGQVRRTYTHFSCVMAQVDGSWPDVTIQRSGFLAKALSLVGLGDIEVESEEFNRLFSLRSPDRRFAITLVDARMIDFLVSTEASFAFAMKGRWVLLASNPVEPAMVPALMRVAETFVAHIPRVVYELWPSPFRDPDGRPLPAGDEGYGFAVAAVERDEADPWDIRLRPAAETVLDDGRPAYDLEGNLVPELPEDPWGDGRPRPR